jgi:hypothetical protein
MRLFGETGLAVMAVPVLDRFRKFKANKIEVFNINHNLTGYHSNKNLHAQADISFEHLK